MLEKSRPFAFDLLTLYDIRSELRIGYTDPTHMVEAFEPSNVDTVMIDGRILKRKGRLTALVPEQIVAEAVTMRERVRKRIPNG